MYRLAFTIAGVLVSMATAACSAESGPVPEQIEPPWRIDAHGLEVGATGVDARGRADIGTRPDSVSDDGRADDDEPCPGRDFEQCGGRCVDVEENESHCGDCGLSCSGSLVCVEGDCRCTGAGC